VTISFCGIELGDTVAPLWLVLTNANEDLTSLEIVRGDFRAAYPEEPESGHRERIAKAVSVLVDLELVILYDLRGSGVGPDTCLSPFEVPASRATSVVDDHAFDALVVSRTDSGYELRLSGPDALARRAEQLAV
jgi:hypothetical protein